MNFLLGALMTLGIGLYALPDPREPAGHEPDCRVPDHDGLVRSLPLVWLRWLVVVVVLYAAIAMLRSAGRQTD